MDLKEQLFHKIPLDPHSWRNISNQIKGETFNKIKVELDIEYVGQRCVKL